MKLLDIKTRPGTEEKTAPHLAAGVGVEKKPDEKKSGEEKNNEVDVFFQLNFSPTEDFFSPCENCNQDFFWGLTKKGPWSCFFCEPPKSEKSRDLPFFVWPLFFDGEKKFVVCDRKQRDRERAAAINAARVGNVQSARAEKQADDDARDFLNDWS